MSRLGLHHRGRPVTRAADVWEVARRAAAATMAMAVALFVWSGRPWVSLERAVIVGGSMAETLHGTHFTVQCGDCGYSFSCDAESGFQPADGRAVCPNCGFEGNRLTDEMCSLGQRVLVERTIVARRDPRRWEIFACQVASRDDGSSTEREFKVKRVLGLPGEHVAIRDGEVWVNGEILRKPLAEQRRQALLVHDDNFRPRQLDDSLARWRPARAVNGWRSSVAGHQFSAPATADPRRLDWLEYHHWPCMPMPLMIPRTRDVPIKDYYGFNQGITRQLHAMGDLMLVCRVELRGCGRFALRIHSGHDKFEIEFETKSSELRFLANDRIVTTKHVPLALGRRAMLWEFSVFDRQAILAVGGRQLLCLPFQPSSSPSNGSPSNGSPTPVAVGCSGLTATISSLRVFRDMYYFDPGWTETDWVVGRSLDLDEFFLLGDNVPISVDSRQWPARTVTRKSLIGKVLSPSSSTNDPRWPAPAGAIVEVSRAGDFRYICRRRAE